MLLPAHCPGRRRACLRSTAVKAPADEFTIPAESCGHKNIGNGRIMSMIMTAASMSLDGFISGAAKPGSSTCSLGSKAGDVDVPTADPNMTFRMTETGATHFQGIMNKTGAIIVGRKLFDLTQRCGGQHPLGCPVVALTHRPPADWPHEQFHFVSTGIEDAVKNAIELADGKLVQQGQRWRGGQPMPGIWPARGSVDRSGPGPARWWNTVVPRRARCASASGAGIGAGGRRGDAPPLPRPA